MPIHDWTSVRANRFHDFHQTWMTGLKNKLNDGVLPAGYYAQMEQIVGGPEADVLAFSAAGASDPDAPGVALAEKPVRVHHQTRSETWRYARRADQIVVRHPDGDPVCVIELVSPGNKDSVHALRQFVRKSVGLLRGGANLLVIDLLPPSRRDPQGIHKAIWDRVRDEDFALPAGKTLTVAAYSTGSAVTAFVEPLAVGDALPDMPIFLMEGRYIPCPLEETYLAAMRAIPAIFHPSASPPQP